MQNSVGPSTAAAACIWARPTDPAGSACNTSQPRDRDMQASESLARVPVRGLGWAGETFCIQASVQDYQSSPLFFPNAQVTLPLVDPELLCPLFSYLTSRAALAPSHFQAGAGTTTWSSFPTRHFKRPPQPCALWKLRAAKGEAQSAGSADDD